MTGAAVQNGTALQDGWARYGAPPFLRFAGHAECHMAFGPSKWMNIATVTPRQAGVQPLEVLDSRFRGNGYGTRCTTERSEESFQYSSGPSRRGD